jgi:hypothetical protein
VTLTGLARDLVEDKDMHVTALAWSACLVAAATGPANEPDRGSPNVVLIMCDQFSAHALSCHGGSVALEGPWRDQRFADFILKIGRLDLPLEQNYDVRVADRTVERIRVLAGRHQPFMITCSFNGLHDPNVVPTPYYDAFDPDKIELPIPSIPFGHDCQLCEPRVVTGNDGVQLVRLGGVLTLSSPQAEY